ncbi:MAG TPA: ATP-binding protein [Bacteriovoracaceae bacterium]|nr:ATP-binding protein [Bacteriovoracaceae bacterium]
MSSDSNKNLERDRIEALSAYHILDSSQESEYEEITELASSICNTPVAFISFLDQGRQWFKARKGLTVPEISREFSICEKLHHGNALAQVRDLSQDSSFSAHPFVREAPVKKFYASMPFYSFDGFLLGTLCVVDFEAKDLDGQQVFLLKALARQIETCLELRRVRFTESQQEANLQILNKTAALGMMTVFVAHEINNSLGILNGYNSILITEMEKRDPPDDLLPFVRKMESTNLRISKVIKGIKTYTRDTGHDPFELVSLRRLMEDTVGLCDQRCRPLGTQLILKLPESDVMLECHSTQISQVFLNLINNALDAVCALEHRWVCVEVNISCSGQAVEFSVSDSGAGIPENIARHLLKPFFTTKEKGKGTGIGLSICKSIIESHQGKFFYQSESKHTKFGIELPLRQ